MSAPKSLRGLVLAQAAAVAMRVRMGQLVQCDLDHLFATADGLGVDDGARVAVVRFRAAIRAAGRQADALQEAGHALLRDALREMVAWPVDRGRVDIHG
jgi:hypothetical protein